MAGSGQPVTIRQYGGNPLYHAAEGRHLSLEELGGMAEDNEDSVVSDTISGNDITAVILKQIITERAHHG